jgi:hypothetical protein
MTEDEGLNLRSLTDTPFLLVARAGEFGGRGFRFTGGEIVGGGCGRCLPKDSRDERLRLVGRMGRMVAAGLGVEEREECLGGKREGSIILFDGP